MRRSLGSVLLLVCGMAAATEPVLLFRAGFDGSTAAGGQAGGSIPLEERGISFGPGAGGQGQALRASRKTGTRLKYALSGHLLPASGTIMLWYKPEWNGSGADNRNRANWRTLVSTDVPRNRIGSGAIQVWCWGDVIRGDRGDKYDSFRTGIPLRNGEWHHLAFSWSCGGSQLYVNGELQPLAGDSAPLRIVPETAEKESPELHNLFIGNCNGIDQADGWIDEVQIWSAPLSPDRISREAQRFRPLHTTVLSGCFMAGTEPQHLRFRMENRGRNQETLQWELVSPEGRQLRNGSLQLAPGERRECVTRFNLAKGGDCTLRLEDSRGNRTQVVIRALSPDNPLHVPRGPLQLSPVDEVSPAAGLPKDRFVAIGVCRKKKLGATEYLEAGSGRCDRFAVRFQLPDPHGLYLVEWEFPDDRKRTMDVTGQSSRIGPGDFRLQTGALAGDLYRNTGTFVKQQAIYFANDRDFTLIFMTARAGEPAAVSRIRIHEIKGGLPDAGVEPASPVQGVTRTVGLYFEDPALNYLFGVPAETPAGAEAMLNRLTAYMKYSGQNLLAYPMVWYQGYMGGAYNPRNHVPGFFDMLLTRFDQEELDFLGTINLNTLPDFPFESVTAKAVANGELHSSAATILRDGRPHIGGWHDTPPNFNILHPQVQKLISGYVERMLETGAPHRSFRGIVLHVTRHSLLSFGDLGAGYNDYAIEAFEAKTGVRVPVDRNNPQRGRLYAEWLLANAREAWINWRCDEIAAFYRSLAKTVAVKRPDLKLVVNCMIPPSKVMHRQDFCDPGFPAALNREAGIDSKRLRDIPNLILEQSIFPADYRWEEGRVHRWPNHYRHLRVLEMQQSCYQSLEGASSPWLHMHDRYWESAVGSRRKSHWSDKPNPLSAPWLTETSWRVSALSPAGIHAMRYYILPFRYHDLLGVTRGGFLIGTYGMESQLAAFARSFRALPARRFQELPGASETVKIRSLRDRQCTWFYVVNTSETPETLTVVSDGGAIADAATGRQLSSAGEPLKLKLGPWAFCSYRTEGGIRVVSNGERGQ